MLLFAVMAYTVLAVVSAGRAADSPDAALTRLLTDAQSAAAVPGACDRADIDRLIHILCAGHIRIGVRDEYPLFATRIGAGRQGFEIDLAQQVGHRLGVAVDFTGVKAATRIPVLDDGSVDLVIATMGDTTERETQVRFVRPHYYRSETILIGDRGVAVASWREIPGLTICGTIGNASNSELVAHGARLMLFGEASTLPDRLLDGTCTLAAQDDSFFAYYFTNPGFSERFTAKFSVAQLPWGLAVARQGSDQLRHVLALMSQIFHRDGVLLALARANHIATTFLAQQQAVWNRPECNTESGGDNPNCVLPPANVELEPTPFASRIIAVETWFSARTGYELLLPMLKTEAAWSLFCDGVWNSLVLVVGALVATLVVALLFGGAMRARSPLLRWPARLVTIAMQSSPILLTLVIAAGLVHALMPYSSTTALGAAIAALGLTNGCNAGQAVSEAYASLRAERGAEQIGEWALYGQALGRSATQVTAFLINAAKGTPIASFIGAPELLSALTDITAVSSGRAVTYTVLLLFYTAIVAVVAWMCRSLQHMLEHRLAAS